MGLTLPNFSVRGVRFWRVDQDYHTSLQLMSAWLAIERAVPKMGQSHAYTWQTVIMCDSNESRLYNELYNILMQLLG